MKCNYNIDKKYDGEYLYYQSSGKLCKRCIYVNGVIVAEGGKLELTDIEKHEFKITDDKDIVCCKCGKTNEKFLKLQCGHNYHAECLVDYLADTKQIDEQRCEKCNEVIVWNDVNQVNN